MDVCIVSVQKMAERPPSTNVSSIMRSPNDRGEGVKRKCTNIAEYDPEGDEQSRTGGLVRASVRVAVFH